MKLNHSQRTALHEAGHGIMAFVEGVQAVIDLPRNASDAEKKAAIDQTVLDGPLSRRACASIGLAGVIAECLHDRPDIGETEIEDLVYHGTVEIPPDDMELVNALNKRFRNRAVKAAYWALKIHWTGVEKLSKELVTNDRVITLDPFRYGVRKKEAAPAGAAPTTNLLGTEPGLDGAQR